MTRSTTALLLAALFAATTTQAAVSLQKHVLLISVDGMHAQDLENFIAQAPTSNLAKLAHQGVRYTEARTTLPSDSFPGMLALITGGTPRSTGVYYDDSYDRALSDASTNCAKRGAKVVLDEAANRDANALDGGGLNVDVLPRDPAHGCQVVWPHEYVRVNNAFSVVHAAHGRTAWSDKHIAYDVVRGPDGNGVDEFYSAEITANGADQTVAGAKGNDDLRLKTVLRQIDGLDRAGHAIGMPNLFGMNFQALSVSQKLQGNGYLDAKGTPSAGVAEALQYVDASLGSIVAELKKQHHDRDTLLVITAKHGQSPIAPTQRRIIDKKLIAKTIDQAQPGLTAYTTLDDVALVWLTDSSKQAEAAQALDAKRDELGIAEVIYGDALTKLFPSPAADSRTPDLIVRTQPGVIYSKPTATKLAEHGGLSDDDRHVALLVVAPGTKPKAATVSSEVETRQVAPTMLKYLGLDAAALDALKQEPTSVLPGMRW